MSSNNAPPCPTGMKRPQQTKSRRSILAGGICNREDIEKARAFDDGIITELR
tara:strand:- start:2284 stop:2439 length:156 start_codon:yes stop_codon:yes gene_type:complete